MTKWRVGSVSFGVVLAACVLTGCSDPPASVAYATRPGVAAGLVLDPLNGPAATWIEEGETFAIVTWGSASCPPVPTALAPEGPDRIVVTFAPSPNDPCTADLSPTTHEFALPDDVTGTPVAIEISYENSTERDSLILR